jgi:hypothetical protein
MHPANNVTYVMANDNEVCDQETKKQFGMALHIVSKEEGQSCLIGQQGYEILLIAYCFIFGRNWEP